MIGICTDSSAQLPAELATRHGIAVVPLTVTVDGVDHLEGVDLDADGFYRHFSGGRRPEVSTAAPGPGRFLAAWEQLTSAGATEVVSIHIGADLSATVGSATVAARDAPVRVRVVDTGTASFAVACSVLAAADRLAAGGTAAGAAELAGQVGRSCGNVFITGGLDLARAGGRLDISVLDDDVEGVPVLRLAGATMQTAGTARTAEEAAELMAREVLAAGRSLRVGVGTSDESSRPVGDGLERRLAAIDGVEVLRYRVGPSVGAHTGPGTAGAVYHVLPG
jgi:DegV family protein with EDD domain